MTSNIPFKTIWRSSSLPGIVLAAVSTAYLLLNNEMTKDPGKWTTLAITVLDMVKIVACIMLMNLFLKNFAADNSEATRYDVRRVGKWIAFLSALIFATASMAFFKFHPEIVDQSFDLILKENLNKLDSNTLNAIENMRGNMPRIVFVSQLIYCFLFGWVLSAILATKIIPDNPFAGEDITDTNSPEEQ